MHYGHNDDNNMNLIKVDTCDGSDSDNAISNKLAHKKCYHIDKCYYEHSDFNRLSKLELHKLKMNLCEQKVNGLAPHHSV